MTADPQRLAAAGLQGWRAKVGDAVAGPGSRHTPLDEDQIRALVGVTFLALGVVYVVKAASDLVRAMRG